MHDHDILKSDGCHEMVVWTHHPNIAAGDRDAGLVERRDPRPAIPTAQILPVKVPLHDTPILEVCHHAVVK
jgi:hypothetical protein